MKRYLLTLIATLASAAQLLAADVTLSVGFSNAGSVTWTVQSLPANASAPTINQAGPAPAPGSNITNTAVATFASNSTPGAYVFRATATSGGLTAFSDATVTVMGSQTITFNALAARSATDPDFSPGATASSALTVTYASSNTAVATIVGDKIHIVGPGSTTITASQTGNATYAPAANVTQNLTVNLASQQITWATLSSKTIGDVDFSPGATASSTLAVTYASSNTAVATVVNNMIHIVGAGSTTITATQAGNTIYAQTSANQTLVVAKRTQVITFAGLPTVRVGAADITPSASSSSGLTITLVSSNPAVATIVNGKIHVVGAGSAIITASQVGDATWAQAADVSQTLSVGTALPPVVTVPATATPSTLILP